MKITLKILSKIGFVLLAALVFVGFVYPFFSVPKKYEDRARAMAEERLEESGVTAEPSYIEESVSEAMNGSLYEIFREALLIASASALVLFCLAIRPPHDCGGLNLFNPIYLVFVALLPLLTAAVLFTVMKTHGAESVALFNRFTADLMEGHEYAMPKLLFIVMIPLVLEGVFRGIIFSSLEKLHFIVAIIISPLLYAAAAYLAVGAYTRWSMGSNAPAMVAMCIALVVGFVNGVMTWRLRSGIPAALAHMFMAYSAGAVSDFCTKHSVTPALAVSLLCAALAVFVLLPALFGKKVKVLAYDFPLTKHHEWMNDWLYGRMRRFGKKKAAAEETKELPAETAEGPAAEEEKPAGPAPAEEKPEEPAEEKTEEPAEEITEEPAEEKTEEPVEEKPEEPVEEKPEEPAEEKPEEPAEENSEDPAPEAEKEE